MSVAVDVDAGSRALLAAELARTGQGPLARRLLDGDPRLGRPAPALLPAGGPAPLAADLEVDPELRGVALLAQARRETPPAAGARLLATARTKDARQGEVATALVAWPPP